MMNQIILEIMQSFDASLVERAQGVRTKGQDWLDLTVLLQEFALIMLEIYGVKSE